MAATFRSAASNGQVGSSVTVTTPTGTADGDLMIMFGGADTIAQVWESPVHADFTNLVVNDDGSTHNWAIAYAVVSGTPAASYEFGKTASGDGVACILTFQESGGGWTVPTAGMYSENNGTSTDAVTTSLTANAGDAVAAAFNNDGLRTLDVNPSGMTSAVADSQGSFSITSYYQDNIGSGAFTKTQTYTVSDEFAALAVLVREAGAAGTTITIPTGPVR